MNKIDLNAPAFGDGAVKLEDTVVPASDTPAEGSQPEEGKSEDGQKVPYSRFETIRQRAEEAERVAQEAQDRVRDLESKKDTSYEPSQYEDDIRSRVIKLYGDNDTSREIISIEIKRAQALEERAEERARQAAIEAVRTDRQQEERAITQNEQTIDNRLEDLSGFLGRDLTAKEEDALLDVVDEYTPKNSDGTYAGETIPFDKAWEIVEMRNAQKAASNSRSRQNATALTGSKTEGEPSTGSSKEWRGGWNNYQDRFKN